MKTEGIILSTEVTCPSYKMPEYLGNSWCVRIAEIRGGRERPAGDVAKR